MPDYIIVWGVRLYNGLPDWNGVGSKLFINEHDSTDIWSYTINGKSIPAIKVHHPSSPSGKSWSFWHEFYKKLGFKDTDVEQVTNGVRYYPMINNDDYKLIGEHL